MSPAEYYKKVAAVPDGPCVVKLTDSPAANFKFHRAFSRTWFVKGYFIQQNLHTLRGSPISAEIDIKCNVKQRPVFVIRDSL